MAERSPAFQFYPSSFLSSSKVTAMNLEQRGAYITLLCFAWMDGSIPNDLTALANLCHTSAPKMKKLWGNISECFVEAEGSMNRLVNPRMEEERQKQAQYRDKQAKNGVSGASKRWGRHSGAMPSPSIQNGGATVSPMANDSSLSLSSSLSLGNKDTYPGAASAAGEPPGFARFWKAYPSGPAGRKGGRTETLKRWVKLKCEPMADEIIAAVKKFAASPDWTKDDGQFIPGAATWLNKRRWEAAAEMPKVTRYGDELEFPPQDADEIERLLRGAQA